MEDIGGSEAPEVILIRVRIPYPAFRHRWWNGIHAALRTLCPYGLGSSNLPRCICRIIHLYLCSRMGICSGLKFPDMWVRLPPEVRKLEQNNYWGRLSRNRKGKTMATIDMKATGENIRAFIKKNKMKITEVQAAFGFNTPQAIYKWMRGDTIPTIDNIVVLADIFGVGIGDIVVVSRKGA